MHLSGQNYKEIQSIKASYLTQHFKQMAVVLEKHYRYAFILLKCNHQMRPSQFRMKIGRVKDLLLSILANRKKDSFQGLRRRIEERIREKEKSAIIIVGIMTKSVTILLFQAMTKLQSNYKAKTKVPKDIALFLIISLSNLKKLVTSAKIEAFNAVKSESGHRRLMINKAKVISLNQSLAFLMKSNLRWALNRLRLFELPQNETYPQVDSQSADGDENDDDEVMVECYKSMAFNLQKLINRDEKGPNLVKYRKEMGASTVFGVLNLIYERTVGGGLLCLDGSQGGREETIDILRRQIAILQKEYQST